MLLGNKTIVFTRHFVSPTLGNVYIGKKAVVSQHTAEKLIAAELAEMYVEKKKPLVVKNDGRGNTGTSKKPSKGDAE